MWIIQRIPPLKTFVASSNVWITRVNASRVGFAERGIAFRRSVHRSLNKIAVVKSLCTASYYWRSTGSACLIGTETKRTVDIDERWWNRFPSIPIRKISWYFSLNINFQNELKITNYKFLNNSISKRQIVKNIYPIVFKSIKISWKRRSNNLINLHVCFNRWNNK